MGRKTSTSTLAKLFVLFLEERTWSQKDLERRCGVGVAAIRKCIFDMQEAGIPLSSELEHPHVYWSVPKGWFPGRGAELDTIDAHRVARLIARLPKSKNRERVLAKIIHPAFAPAITSLEEQSDLEDEVIDMLEQGVRTKTALRMIYFTASRGEQGSRTVSVQRVVYSQKRPRFVAWCHASNKLKWFRVDRVTRPRPDPVEPYVARSTEDVDQLVAESLDGFHGEGTPYDCTFFVSGNDHRWITRNLPTANTASSFVVDPRRDGALVSVTTSALDILARFLVGLGPSARVLSPTALQRRVCELAEGALEANRGAEQPPSQRYPHGRLGRTEIS